MGLMEAERGESCPPGQCQGPAAPGEDTYPSPYHKSVHTYLYNSNNPEKKPQIPGVDTSPQGVEIPNPWVIAGWMGLMEAARGESCPLGQRRGPATPGEDKFLSEILPYLCKYNKPGTNTHISRVDTVPAGCGNLNPTG